MGESQSISRNMNEAECVLVIARPMSVFVTSLRGFSITCTVTLYIRAVYTVTKLLLSELSSLVSNTN